MIRSYLNAHHLLTVHYGLCMFIGIIPIQWITAIQAILTPPAPHQHSPITTDFLGFGGLACLQMDLSHGMHSFVSSFFHSAWCFLRSFVFRCPLLHNIPSHRHILFCSFICQFMNFWVFLD